MSLADDLIAILGSRLLLGICALVLAGSALRGQFDSTEQIGEQTEEQQCFEDLNSAVVSEFGEALQRIEQGLRALSQGDEDGLARAVSISEAEQKAYDKALSRQENAVNICGR